ncbi:hypothetical protein ASF30_11355 [Leifsonia sp. Leaf264]|nr:hypothetical protein ASF30_11355 [Leifsonia sp. Leaf264]
MYGNAGGSLEGGTFAANKHVARFGAAGEKKTAALLAELAATGPTVLHDLKIPNQKFTANIDHAIVSGNKVVLVDTKAWAGNFYWTFAGATYRGLKRFATVDKQGKTTFPAEKKTLPMAKDAIAAYLGVPKENIRLALIIWPTGKKPLTTWLMRSPGGATVLNGPVLTVGRLRSLAGKKEANEFIVRKLAQLVIR